MTSVYIPVILCCSEFSRHLDDKLHSCMELIHALVAE